MKEKKFIINNNNVIFAYVKRHDEIQADHTKTTAGGRWFIDEETGTLYLYDGSAIFGYASQKDIFYARYPEWCQKFSINFQPEAEFLHEINANGKLLQEKESPLQLVGA